MAKSKRTSAPSSKADADAGVTSQQTHGPPIEPVPDTLPRKRDNVGPTQGVDRLFARFPVLTFVIATLIWSYLLWNISGKVYVSVGEAANNNRFLRVIAGVGSIGPTLTALMVTATLYGEIGVQQLLQRVVVRHNIFLWSWLLAPWISGGLLLVWWRASDGKDHPFQWNDLIPRIIPALAYGVITALAEEIGWRGFLLPKLLRQLPPLRAALISGFIVAAWNALPYFLGVPTAGRAAGAVLGPVPVLSLIPLAIIQCYLYQQSRGSLTLAFAFSMSSAAAYVLCSLPLFDGTEESRLYYSVFEVVACNVIALPAFVLLQLSGSRHVGDIAEVDGIEPVEPTASKKTQ